MDKESGRIKVHLGHDGARDHHSFHGVELQIRSGWNDACKFVINYLSVEETRDLHYILGRVIAEADEVKARSP